MDHTSDDADAASSSDDCDGIESIESEDEDEREGDNDPATGAKRRRAMSSKPIVPAGRFWLSESPRAVLGLDTCATLTECEQQAVALLVQT